MPCALGVLWICWGDTAEPDHGLEVSGSPPVLGDPSAPKPILYASFFGGGISPASHPLGWRLFRGADSLFAGLTPLCVGVTPFDPINPLVPSCRPTCVFGVRPKGCPPLRPVFFPPLQPWGEYFVLSHIQSAPCSWGALWGGPSPPPTPVLGSTPFARIGGSLCASELHLVGFWGFFLH